MRHNLLYNNDNDKQWRNNTTTMLISDHDANNNDIILMQNFQTMIKLVIIFQIMIATGNCNKKLFVTATDGMNIISQLLVWIMIHRW